MDVYLGVKCSNCFSSMFPYHINQVNNAIGYTCPRNCQYGYLHNPGHLLTQIQINKIYLMLNFGNIEYHSNCWNCKKEISSLDPHALRDVVPSLGYICPYCKSSLRGLFIMKNVITSHFVNIPPAPAGVSIHVFTQKIIM